MAAYEEKEKGVLPHSEVNDQDVDSMVGKTSPGVLRMEAISAHISTYDRVAIFFGVFLIGAAYGLDSLVRYTYQPMATSSFGTHSLLSTVNVVRGVIAAAAQPTAAKIADVFGRLELVIVSVIFYVLGTIVEATCHNVQSFAAGALLYQIGYTCILLLVEVIIADTTSLRSRVFFSYVPTLPFIVNIWVSGEVSSAVLKNSTWQWGIGMWCIIYPICALPLIISLWWVGRKAKKFGALDQYKTPLQIHGPRKLAIGLFWELDVIGIILSIALFGLILVPFTLAGGSSTKWSQGEIIAPLVIGFLCIPAFIIWEKKAPYPMVPFHLFKDRSVWGALGIAIFLMFAWTCQGDFLYSVLVVGFDESIKSATRIQSLYNFCSVITGVLLGLVVYRVRRLKPFIMLGTCLFMVAFGLLIYYRGGTAQTSHNGIVGAQVLLGIAGGLFPYPAQASIQAATKHEHVAVITGIFLACYNIGSALGNAVSGAIWTQLVPRELNARIPNAAQAARWYASPLGMIADYPPGTPERDAVIEVYKYVQRLLCITAICVCAGLIFFACVIRDPKLGDEQSLPDAEEKTSHGKTSKLIFWKR